MNYHIDITQIIFAATVLLMLVAIGRDTGLVTDLLTANHLNLTCALAPMFF